MAAPVAKRIDHSFSHHGIRVQDPYHWLKDQSYPTVDDADVLAYLKEENQYYEAQMAPMKDLADALFTEMKERQPKEDASVPYKDGDFYYRWTFAKDAQYRVWSRAAVSAPEKWQNILDEPALATGHDYFRLGSFSISPNGRYLAYSVDTNGSERYVLNVKDLQTDTLLDISIDNNSGAPIWAADSQSFFYLKVNDNWQPYLVRKHTLGEDLAQDIDIYEEKDSSFFVGLSATQSDQFVVINTGDHVTSEIRVIPSDAPDTQPQLIAPRRTGHEYDIDHHGEHFFIHSNAQHKNFSMYRVATDNPSEDKWRLEIEGSKKHYLLGIVCFNNFIAISERIDGLDQIRLRNYKGEDQYVEFPEAAYSVGLGDNAEYAIDTLRLEYESLTTPDTTYDYQINQQQLEVKKVQEIPSGYSKEDFQSERIFVTSRDGVEVPVSLVYKKNRQPDSPLYLYAYGAYGSATQPWFSSVRLSLLERGFVFAIAHIRGGDELGYHWYEDGKLGARTNTFNDFVDVAKFLVKENYTDTGKLYIAGGSAGGELMGAVVNQAPELWGGVAAHVPFVDVLNTMLDTSLPLTPMEWPEWGNPIEDKEAFEFIRSYSPYDQITEKAYPPMLVTAGLNDPRVTYWEPAKYVAKLRAMKTDNHPILFKINMGAGHGGKSGRFDSLYETAEEYAFFLTLAGQDS